MSGWFCTYGFADVADGLLIGAYPVDRSDFAVLAAIGIQRVLNLVEDEEYRPGDRRAVVQALHDVEIEERRVGMTDYGRLPAEQLEAAVQQVSTWLGEGRRTYVHCRAGWQRSAAVAAGVVAVRDGVDIDEALASVQARKPTADPLPHQREDLRTWFETRQPAPRSR